MSKHRLVVRQHIARPIDAVFPFFEKPEESAAAHAVHHALRVPHVRPCDAPRTGARLSTPAAAGHPDRLAHAHRCLRPAERVPGHPAARSLRPVGAPTHVRVGHRRDIDDRRDRLRPAASGGSATSSTGSSSAASWNGSSDIARSRSGRRSRRRAGPAAGPWRWRAGPASSVARSRSSCTDAATESSSCRTVARKREGACRIRSRSAGRTSRPAMASPRRCAAWTPWSSLSLSRTHRSRRRAAVERSWLSMPPGRSAW